MKRGVGASGAVAIPLPLVSPGCVDGVFGVGVSVDSEGAGVGPGVGLSWPVWVCGAWVAPAAGAVERTGPVVSVELDEPEESDELDEPAELPFPAVPVVVPDI